MDETRIHERCGGHGLERHQVHESHLYEQAPSGGGTHSFTLPGTPRVYERSRPFVVDHIALDWQVRLAERCIEGTATLTLSRSDAQAEQVELDAVDLEIERVDAKIVGRAGGRRSTRSAGGRGRGQWRQVPVVHDGAVLRVDVATEVTKLLLRVHYRACPLRGLYFLAPDEAVPERPRQIWTQCQDEDARRLFPCHDKPHMRQTFELDVRVEPGWVAISNGQLRSSRAEQKRGRFRFRMSEPIPSYLFSLVAGEFACIEDNSARIPLAYYVPKGREDDARRSFARTPDMVKLFAELTGVPYPWGRYAQVVVHDFIFGGMENAGVTTLYEHVLLDERAAIDLDSDALISHELAHQWFGDLVTCRDWSHGWLNEGFATYLEQIYREHRLGRDEYFQGLADDLQAYLSEAGRRYRRPVVCSDYDAPIDVFDRHLYEKGALVLHALRVTLGDEAFWAGIRRYLAAHAGGVVETRDLQRALEASSGRSLEALFDQYLLRAGHPTLTVTIEHDGKVLSVTVKQSLGADEAPWQLELALDVALGEAASRKSSRSRRAAAPAGAGGRPKLERRVVRLSKPVETFAFPYAVRPRFVVVDPELSVVGKISTQAPADMAREQLGAAPNGRAGTMAAAQLARRSDSLSVRALVAALDDSRAFWGLRAAAARALGAVRSPEARETLLHAARVRHPKVRRAVASALGQFRDDEVAERLGRMAEADPSYLVAAAACRALGATRHPTAFAKLQELIDRPSWADILRAAAIDGLAALRDERAIALLRERTRYGIPSRGRRAAIAALAQLSTDRRDREHLEQLLDAESPMVRMVVVEALGELGDARSRPALETALDRELDARVRRRIRELLRDIGGRGRAELRRLRDDVADLKRKHAELAAKLAKLAASRSPRG